jgi:hypothetical protein
MINNLRVYSGAMYPVFKLDIRLARVISSK